MREKEREQMELTEDQQEEMIRRLLKLSGGRAAVSTEIADRVRESVHLHWKKSIRARFRKRYAFYITATIAASFLFFLLTWYIAPNILPKPATVAMIENQLGSVFLDKGQMSTPGIALLADSVVESGLMGRALLRTPQDVTIRLDVNTRLRFESESHFILERGAIYLDSGPKHGKFQVSTPLGDVMNRGTQFEIRLQEAAMEVRVREGEVSITNEKISEAVTAGKRLTLDQKGKIQVSEFAVYGPSWEWISHISPDFYIEGRTLAEFLVWIAHENGWTLEGASPIQQSHGRIVLHGSVESLSPAQMLGAVLPVCGLTYTLDAGVLKVYPAERK